MNCAYCGKPVSIVELPFSSEATCLSCAIKRNIQWKRDILWEIRRRFRRKPLRIKLIDTIKFTEESFDVSGLSNSSVVWLMHSIPCNLRDGQYVKLEEVIL